MSVKEKNENEFLRIEKSVPETELKVTSNGRLFLKEKNIIEEYYIQIRISFSKAAMNNGVIQTDHVLVRISEEGEVQYLISVLNQDIEQDEHGKNCKIIEKEKGIDFKCIINKRNT